MASAPNYNDDDDKRPPSIIRSPMLPYVATIPGGLFPGRAIVIKGSVLSSSDVKRFQVDLCCGLLIAGDHQDNKALHFNPRFETSSSWFSGKADHQIVLNSLVNNRWGVEERYGNVFKEGRPFSLRILVLSEYFKIAVDGRHLCDYLYRIGINDVQTIFISGNINVDLIEFQGEVSPSLLHREKFFLDNIC
uniref:Galectin n=1 Tax=Ascaris lumbricoides TaxID=6252 RepID=A0A0M3IRY8_ASCLU